MGTPTVYSYRLLRAPSSPTLDVSKDRASTIPVEISGNRETSTETHHHKAKANQGRQKFEYLERRVPMTSSGKFRSP